MIIWLASYPRSGNTFFRVLLKHVYDIAVYEPYPSNPVHDAAPFKDIVGDAQLPFSLAEMGERDEVYIVKTHDMPPDDHPAIYLVRDGRDALVSHARFVLDYDRPPDNPETYYGTVRRLIEASPFGGWGANVEAWTTRRASTVVRFEELIAAPLHELRRAISAIGCELPEIRSTDPPAFAELHRKIPQFFRAGRVGAWREELPGNLHALFWHRHGDAMHKMGYTDGELSAFEVCQAERSIAKPVRAGGNLTFGTSGNGISALVRGWGMPEEWGTWSIAKQASLKFAIGSGQDFPLKADLKYRSFIPNSNCTLNVECRAGGKEIDSWACTAAARSEVRRLTIPSNVLGFDGAVTLDFVISEPRSPAELGLSSDSRPLGIGVESLHFVG